MSVKISVRIVNDGIMDAVKESADKQGLTRSRLVENILAQFYSLEPGEPKHHFSTVSREECQSAQKDSIASRAINKENIGKPEEPFFTPKEKS